MTFDGEAEFSKNGAKITSVANTLRYEIEQEFSELLKKHNLRMGWKPYYKVVRNREPKEFIVEFSGSRTALDWLVIAIERVKATSDVAFDAFFVNPSTLEISKDYQSIGATAHGRLYICNITQRKNEQTRKVA